MFRSSSSQKRQRRLRTGFSTGACMAAAARAALRHLLRGEDARVVAVRLPDGCLVPIDVRSFSRFEGYAQASVIKDGGDDPDVTHRAEICVKLRCLRVAVDQTHTCSPCRGGAAGGAPATVCVIGGEGIGVVTKPGLPIPVGEPAINPVPRQMLCRNLVEELLRSDRQTAAAACAEGENGRPWLRPTRPHVLLPLVGLPQTVGSLHLEVEVQAPKGKDLAGRTLNPRLGILGGISILGTTGLVKPFSHEAYQETIQSALSVAASNGCRQIVLSTGGKSERYAQRRLPGLPPEAFIQIADFYAFSLNEAKKMGFEGIVHSVFFGKLVKMAQGHPYTHAHKADLNLAIVGRAAEAKGYDRTFRRQLETANTARHALDLLLERGALDVVRLLADRAGHNSGRITENKMPIRILLFDYEGNVLMDVDQ